MPNRFSNTPDVGASFSQRFRQNGRYRIKVLFSGMLWLYLCIFLNSYFSSKTVPTNSHSSPLSPSLSSSHSHSDSKTIPTSASTTTKTESTAMSFASITSHDTKPIQLNVSQNFTKNNDDSDTVAWIQVASDLHLEFYGSPDNIPDDIIVPRAPILALLGDVGLAFTDSLEYFLHQQADRFEHVLYLAGNHEFYNRHHHQNSNGDDIYFTVSEQLQWLQDVCAKKENLHFMEKDVFEIVNQNIVILGTTLWSQIPQDVADEAEHSMNDYHLSYMGQEQQQNENGDTEREKNPPSKLKPRHTNEWFEQSHEWLQEQLKSYQDRSVIVLTHHTPSMTQTSKAKYEGSALTSCFSSDLTSLLQPPIVAWACGHTHFNFDITFPNTNGNTSIGDNNEKVTRLVSNQRGYPGREAEGYDPHGTLLAVPTSLA